MHTEHIINNTTTPTPTTANNNNKVHNRATVRPWFRRGKDDTIFLIVNIKNIVIVIIVNRNPTKKSPDVSS